mmetsp:Transcript_84351/g.103378  ORF Transcript_84351/g.103378 Transcript_84351/m.103378 type:complete len:129 (+) Transcript_84351:1-387(+)
MEFRGFVDNGALNCLSQYNYFMYFEDVKIHKKTIEKNILQFWKNNCQKQLKKYDNYVIDFAVCGDNLDTIYVIELNPFMYSTDGALFNWKNDDDRKIISNGPWEFRIIDKYIERPNIETKYKKILGWE